MKLLLAMCLLAFSTVAFAETTYEDVQRAQQNAYKVQAESSSRSERIKAYENYQAVEAAHNRSMAEQMNRTPDENRRRNQIIQEEKWRAEVRGR